MRRKVKRAAHAEINRRVFFPLPVADIAPNAPSISLTEGEPWNGATLEGLPFDPETTDVRSASTASRPMQAWFLPNALIAPADGLVLSRWSRRIVAESINTGVESLNSGPEQSVRLRRLLQLRPSSVTETASLLFSPGRNYYHSLVDNLARVCAFGLSPLSSDHVEVLYNGPLTAVERLVLDRIRPPNVSLRPLSTDRLVRAERLALPTFPAWRFSGWLPSWYVTRLRQALVPDRPPRRSERLYVVRRGARRVTNEEELLRTLNRHGFRPVQLEHLSFLEQVELFYDAEAVVAPHGAGLTNLLFANTALVVEIFSTQYVYPHYVMMARSLGHEYRFVLGARTTRWEDFETDPSSVESEVVAGLEMLGKR